jgi:hypothetical protein
MEYVGLIILALIALFVMYKLKENFTETSYYYEAAPGSRGARMVCMPEGRGTASLGVAVNRATTRAMQPGKRSCAPLAVDHSRVDRVYRAPAPRGIKAKTCACPFAPLKKKTKNLAPALYATMRDPTRPVIRKQPGASLGKNPVMYREIDGEWITVRKNMDDDTWVPMLQNPAGKWVPAQKTAEGTWVISKISKKAGCPSGKVWDAGLKKCRLPKASDKKKSGCPPGKVWDAGLKKCRLPKASDKKKSGCPPGKVWDAGLKKCRLPKAKVASKKKVSGGKKKVSGGKKKVSGGKKKVSGGKKKKVSGDKKKKVSGDKKKKVSGDKKKKVSGDKKKKVVKKTVSKKKIDPKYLITAAPAGMSQWDVLKRYQKQVKKLA